LNIGISFLCILLFYVAYMFLRCTVHIFKIVTDNVV